MKDEQDNPYFHLRDGATTSAWFNSESQYKSENYDLNHLYDTLIIGAGITGLTTALLLQQAGQKCIIIDAHSIGFGTTGGTSAHLNTFFDSTYPEIESDFGETGAQLAADSGKEAFRIIEELVSKYNIDCDFEHKDALLYSENEKESKQLDEILESFNKYKVEAEPSSNNNIPIPFDKVVRIKKQGQFQPLKYVYGLANVFTKLGGAIVQNQIVKNTEQQEGVYLVECESLKIKAKNIVYATHHPFGINQFNFTCAPYRSYVVGVTLKNGNYPKELIYDMQEPYHYLRTHHINGRDILLIGGEDHKTGHDNPEDAFKKLLEYTYKYFDVDEVVYQWSSQYYIPSDGLPYIGKFPGKGDNCYVATGYSGNGMMFGTLSGKIISDAILGIQNPYADLYNPARIKPIAGFKEFVKENADVAWRFIADRLSASKLSSLNEMEKDSGKIVSYENERIAVYKDANGAIHALNPTCTHAGCIVAWNQSEKSWDCPCHGGRYDIDGKVITGPPQKALQKINIE